MTITTPLLLDLHMHSVVSDGTDSPAEILEHVKAAGIELFSLTDHDAIQGCVELERIICLAAMARTNCMVVPVTILYTAMPGMTLPVR